MHCQSNHKPNHFVDNMALAPLDFFAGITFKYLVNFLFCMDLLSTTTTVGLGFLQCNSRDIATSRRRIIFKMPSSQQPDK
jgi:hypothetical protein